MFKTTILIIIAAYQRSSRLKHNLLFYFFPQLVNSSQTPLCRFSPTCSRYLYQAIATHGILKGVFLGVKRFFRCHPWSIGGYDPVPGT